MLRSVLFACAAFLGAHPLAAQDTQLPFASFDIASAPILNDPHDLAFGPDGNLYVADKFANRVTILDPETLEFVGSIGDGQLFGAHDVSFDSEGRLYVAATAISAVAVYDLGGDAAELVSMLGRFPNTEGALAHSNGRLYVMVSGTGQLAAISDNELVALADGMVGAHDVAQAPDGTIWVADNRAQRLVQFDEELTQLAVLDDPKFGFVGPRYMDFADDGTLIVADQDAHRVLRIDPVAGDLLGVIGSGEPGLGPNLLDDPEGVAVRGNEFYFADSDNNRIVRYVVLLN